MTRKTAIGCIGVLMVMGLLSEMLVAAEKAAVESQPTVEVAFVLDTTGSMSGLIDGAKRKIWSVANQILLGEPRPSVRMALVGYRDKGDAYVTKVFPLSDNIDKVYENLMAFQAEAGGDEPENVNQALYDAIHKLGWSKDRKTLKIIYLVGDCPPHNEYQDVATYDKLAKQAVENGIFINTILCGNNEKARGIWQEIARMSEGSYFAIAQDGGMQDVATPYDEDLAKLNQELIGTVVVFGSRMEQREATARNESVSKRMAAPAMASVSADRASFASKSGKAGSGDLVEAVQNKVVSLEKIEQDTLPENMQKMSLEEQKEYLKKQQASRDTLNAKIKELSEKRTAYIKKELESKTGAKDSFDAKVLEALQTQAASKNITYKNEAK